jgi:hypothetical protein
VNQQGRDQAAPAPASGADLAEQADKLYSRVAQLKEHL